MGAAAPKTKPEMQADPLVEELETLMAELDILATRQDGLAGLVKARKSRAQAILNELGKRSVKNDHGTCFFTPKRSFTTDAEKATKLPKKVLVQGFKASGPLVDACAKRGVDLKGAVTIGVYETFTYSRPRGKQAEAFRKEAVTRSMQEAEEKMSEIMENI